MKKVYTVGELITLVALPRLTQNKIISNQGNPLRYLRDWIKLND